MDMLWLTFQWVVSISAGFLAFLIANTILNKMNAGKGASVVLSIIIAFFASYFIFKALFVLTILAIIAGLGIGYLFGGVVVALILAYLFRKARGG